MASTALVVDDDPSFLALAARILEAIGVDVVATAPDAAAAVTAANATRPDAALIDYGLPDRDGADLACELAALPWRPRVVLTSSDRDAGTAIPPRESRRLPFIHKEDLPNALLRQLLVAE